MFNQNRIYALAKGSGQKGSKSTSNFNNLELYL